MNDQTEHSPRCSALTKKGTPCPAPATPRGLCFFHENPEKAVELGRRGGLKNRHVRPDEDVELPPLNTAEDVRSMLAKAAQDVRNRRIDPRVATSLGQLATTLLKAIEVADVERRLAQLEGVNNGSEKTS
jgi:hypothetical protein